jgi:hypothetical protein
MYVVYFERNKTKSNGHELFLFEEYSSNPYIGIQKTLISFHYSFSSTLMRFLPELYYPLMTAGLTYKMATLPKSDPILD